MNAELVRQLANQGLTSLSESLDAGKSQALTSFLAALARFHRYSFGNVMLILSQRPDATHVAGFHTWKSLGRFVMKGEKGLAIIAPMILKRREASAVGHDDRCGEGDVEKVTVRYRIVHVFDITQTDGEPLPEPRRTLGDPGERLEMLRRFIADQGIAVGTEALPMGVLGESRGGSIVIASGLSPAEEFSVLVHELAHEMLHQAGRAGVDAPRPSKKVRETEAEAVAYVVNTAIGLDAVASVDNIQMY